MVNRPLCPSYPTNRLLPRRGQLPVGLGNLPLAAALPVHPGLLPLLFHELMKPGLIHRKSKVSGHIGHDIDGKAVGVVKLENEGAREWSSPFLLQAA